MQNQSSQIFRLGTLLIDGVLLIALFVVIGLWRFDDLRISNPEYYNYYLQLLVLTLVSWYAAGRWSGMFTYTSGLEHRNVTANVLRGALAQMAILAIIVVGLKGYYYSRLFLGTYFALLYGIALIYRLIFVQFLRNQMAKGKWQRTFIVSGNHSTSEALVALTELRPELGWKHAGSVSASELETHTFTAQDLICAYPPSTSEYAAAQRYASSNGMRFRFLPDMGAHYAGELFLESLEGIPLFSARKEPLANWSNKLIKRIFDILFSSLLIIILLSWLLPILAIMLLLTGAGNPLFIQRREGLEGKTFAVLKLRTMRANSKSNALQRWMRKTGVDELPQLFNVFFGQMSLVGPRPHTEGDGVQYAEKIGNYKIRHWAKPGLTGLAQTRGLRGGDSAANEQLLEARIRADIYYVEHWSVLLDLRILIETLVRTLFAPSSLHQK
jgi:lipopolysaccharide/colanic/teichoic acid biosynthesis glycosyltransferase